MSIVQERKPGGVAGADQIGEAPDRDEILRTVRIYTDGMGAHDPAVFEQAFHPTARISYTTPDGVLHEGPIAEGFGVWAEWPGPVSLRLLAIVQAGDVATVVIGFDSATGLADSWLDIHSLLGIDGRWVIANKTATHATRAGWAAPAAADAGSGGGSH